MLVSLEERALQVLVGVPEVENEVVEADHDLIILTRHCYLGKVGHETDYFHGLTEYFADSPCLAGPICFLPSLVVQVWMALVVAVEAVHWDLQEEEVAAPLAMEVFPQEEGVWVVQGSRLPSFPPWDHEKIQDGETL